MLWIRIGFNANPNTTYLDADPDPGNKPMRNHAVSDPGQTLKSKKLNFYMKNILKVGSRSKYITT